jgi:arabinose-5-phosphate isomerase
VRADDVLILISNSGETEELIRLIPAFDRIGIPRIAFTGNMDSTLARHSDLVLDISVDKEACPLNLAPTTSGLTTLVMGDALAITLMDKRGFKVEDFAATHPGGALGKRLLARVSDQMVSQNLPFVNLDDPMPSVILKMTESRLGIALVGSADHLHGIISDGDLRRALGENIDFATTPAQELMSPSPLTTTPETRMADAEAKMQEARVQCLVVMDDQQIVRGIVQIFQPVS